MSIALDLDLPGKLGPQCALEDLMSLQIDRYYRFAKLPWAIAYSYKYCYLTLNWVIMTICWIQWKTHIFFYSFFLQGAEKKNECTRGLYRLVQGTIFAILSLFVNYNPHFESHHDLIPNISWIACTVLKLMTVLPLPSVTSSSLNDINTVSCQRIFEDISNS